MGLLWLMGLMWLTDSCSSDEEPAMGQTDALDVSVAEVRSFATYFDEHVAKTRDWTPPTGYVTYEDGAQSIGIAFTQDFTQDDEEAIRGTFFKSGDKWNFRVTELSKSEENITAGTYYLYGYIPITSGVNFEITDLNGINGKGASFSTGAKVKLTNVPTVMGKDLCVVIGAKEGTDADHDSGLSRGDFEYYAKAITKESVDRNYVFLLFDHLYAALSVNMKVSEEYADLRTIKLKELKLSTQASGATSKAYTTIIVDLLANNTGNDPITAITYTPTGSTIGADGISFWSSSAGVELETIYQDKPFTGHFMPSGINTLVLTSKYDVYDKEGHKTRENCSATNTMPISELWSGLTATSRGNRYTVKMTIQPTYLYVLSEPDLDNPTVTVTTN